MTGQLISRYRIADKLGEGGMGVVYKAQDTTLDRTVALKFLAAHLLNDDEAKQRFLREAKAAASLDHPNICTVYEVGEAEGKTFLAMAFLKGETLEDRIAKGPLRLKDALDIARQVAEGLNAALAWPDAKACTRSDGRSRTRKSRSRTTGACVCPGSLPPAIGPTETPFSFPPTDVAATT